MSESEIERESSLSYFANDLFRGEGREEDKADLERALTRSSFSRPCKISSLTHETTTTTLDARAHSLWGKGGERYRKWGL